MEMEIEIEQDNENLEQLNSNKIIKNE